MTSDKDHATLLEMWREEKKKRQEAEGEVTIVKGIGMNSPEMRALQSRVKELDNSLSISLDINDKHQRELKEVKEDNRKRSKLKNILILISRILAISFLILAFAKPYIPSTNQQKTNNIFLYIDNSHLRPGGTVSGPSMMILAD